MLIKPALTSLLLFLTFNVVDGECGNCVLSPRSLLIPAPCGAETTLGGCLSWQGMCDWEDDYCPTAPIPTAPIDDPTLFPVCANDGGLETCTRLFEPMDSRRMQPSCVAWFSYEPIPSDGFCYMCGGNTIPDIQQLLDGGCNSEVMGSLCLNTGKVTTDEGTGWYKRTYCCHKELFECVQFVEYVQDVDCHDETIGGPSKTRNIREPSCKFFTISSCPEGFDACDGFTDGKEGGTLRKMKG